MPYWVYGFIHQFVNLLFTALIIAIVARALLSWFTPSYQYRRQFYRINRFLASITDPVVEPIRRFGSMTVAGLDFTPLIAILLLDLVRRLVMWVLLRAI